MFFFGDSDKQLYGNYREAHSSGRRSLGVVLCYPYGAESIRAHRIFRTLADQLARSGVEVFRFDYFATGDSAGACSEGTLAQWRADVLSAHRELQDMAGVQRVLWIGLRLGASLALLAARQPVPGLAGLILWNPVIRGRSYLEELQTMHRDFLASELDLPWPHSAKRRARSGAPAKREAMGFEIGAALESELQELDLLSERTSVRKVLLLGDSANTDIQALREHLQSFAKDKATGVSYAALNDAAWNSAKAMNDFVVPTQALKAVVTAVDGWR